MARVIILLLGFFLGLSGAVPIRVGAYTARPGLLEPNLARIEKELGLRLQITELGGVDMLKAVDAGRLDVVFVAGSLENLLETARAHGYSTKPSFEYHHCVVGEDELSVLVNPEVLTDSYLLIAELSPATIRGLFTGRIHNWKEVGGADLPVVVLKARQMHTTNNLFQRVALRGEDFSPESRIVDGSLNTYVDTVSRTRGGIGIGPLPFARSAKVWSPVQAMKIRRPFIMVVSDRVSPSLKPRLAKLVELLRALSPPEEK